MSVVPGLMLEIASKQSTVVTGEGVSSVPVMANEPKCPVASGGQILKEGTSKKSGFTSDGEVLI